MFWQTIRGKIYSKNTSSILSQTEMKSGDGSGVGAERITCNTKTINQKTVYSVEKNAGR